MIAYENSGLAISFEPGDQNIAESIETFFLRFATPVLINIMTSLEGLENIVDLYPPGPYTLFAGQQSIIVGRYINEMVLDISVTGEVVGNDITLDFPEVLFPETSEDFAFIPKMWAIQVIDYWLAYMALYGEDQEIIDLIVDLSTRFGVLTDYTHYEDTPVKVLVVRAYQSSTGVELSWNAHQAGVDVRYNVYRRDKNSGAYILLTEKPITETRFVDRKALAGQEYVYMVVAYGDDMVTVSGEVEVTTEGEITLVTAQPNPFNSRTMVTLTLNRASMMDVRVYDILGREVFQLAEGRYNAGQHSITFDGAQLSSGVYFLRTTVRDDSGVTRTASTRLMLLK